MIIPKDAKVNGTEWRKICGNPCYRVKLVGGPWHGQDALTTSTELFMSGSRYVLQPDGDFVFEGDIGKPPVVSDQSSESSNQ